MGAEKLPSAIDDLLDGFVTSLLPPHHRVVGVPFATIEIRKSDLRDAALALLKSYETYRAASIAAARRPARAPTPPPPPPAGPPDPGVAETPVLQPPPQAPEGG